ncbi:stage II sporulation protein R [Clostridium hydrogeniformans]|uniref:stage II sporulation protein R n=1 Tax=Clostridium hydrogeniformans TaxID=349933 RepID=UPI000484D502|nr:stage II sporulation protein R [Clostridium hydrogeniformans]
MKKFLSGILLIVSMVILSSIIGQVYKRNTSENQVEDISNKLIRFHVLANSDSKEDQELKLRVKDEIISFIQPKLKESKSIEESREILRENNERLIEIAMEVIKKNGYDYNVSAGLSKENFPVKVYGDIALPQGEYEAYRILIGNAEGQNWWCVMFPPLCFVDVTKGEVASDETKKELSKVLNNEEMDTVSKDKKIKVKFKLLEVIEDLINKK